MRFRNLIFANLFRKKVRLILTVGFGVAETFLLRLGLERLHHMDEKRKVHSWNRKQDKRLVVGEGGRGKR